MLSNGKCFCCWQQGCLITIDAMGCQTKMANKVVDGGINYLLAAKKLAQTLSCNGQSFPN
jgi:predicted transposase YbfD/YdcC